MKINWQWLVDLITRQIKRVLALIKSAIDWVCDLSTNKLWPRLRVSVPAVVWQRLEGLRVLLAKWTDHMGGSGLTVAEAGRLGQVNRASTYLLWGITAVIFSLLIWAYFTEVEIVSHSMGKVIPSGKLQVIQNLEGGIVQSIHAQPGQRVQEGELLVSLSETQFEGDLQTRRHQAYALAAKLDRLKAESEAKPLTFSNELKANAGEYVRIESAAYQSRKLQLKSQTDLVQAQLEQKNQELQEMKVTLSTAEKTVELGRQEQAILSKMVARGLEPKLELIRLERTLAETEGRAETAKTSILKLRAAIAEAKARMEQVLNQFQSEAQTESNKTLAEYRALQESLPALEDKKGRTEVRSPVAGIVNRVLVTTVGGVVKPGEPIVEVVPADDKLVFEAMVPTADIGFVKLGQTARVKVTAFDYSVFGAMTGKVTRVAADATTTEKGESFYIARIETPSPLLEVRGNKLAVMPGMQAQIDIVTGYRSIWDYLMKPVMAVKENAFKER